MSQSKTRNHLIVGKNSKSYDDKHPENPVSLRPIRDAIENTPKVLDAKHRFIPDYKRIQFFNSLRNMPRMTIAEMTQ